MLSVLDLKLGNACGNVVTKIHYRLPIHINVATCLSAGLIGLKTVEAPSDEEVYKAAIRGPSAVSRMRFTMAEDYVYRNITVERGGRWTLVEAIARVVDLRYEFVKGDQPVDQ
nr:hypothetical protein [Pyrobaculum aerophilum]